MVMPDRTGRRTVFFNRDQAAWSAGDMNLERHTLTRPLMIALADLPMGFLMDEETTCSPH